MLHPTLGVVLIRVLAVVAMVVVHAPSATTLGAPSRRAVAPPVATDGEDVSHLSFVLRPAAGQAGDYITITAAAGSTTEHRVFLGNTGAEPVRLRTYVAPTLPMSNGGYAVATADATREGTAAWIAYPTEELDLRPGEGVERAFTLTIPEVAAPGQYIAGLVLETAEPLPVPGSGQFTAVIRASIAVLVIVPGPETPAFGLGDPVYVVDAREGRLEIPVANTGNVLVKPAGAVTVRTAGGKTVLTAPIAMGSVYAGTTAPLVVDAAPPLPEGDYLLSITLTDAATGVSASLRDHPIVIGPERTDAAAHGP